MNVEILKFPFNNWSSPQLHVCKIYPKYCKEFLWDFSMFLIFQQRGEKWIYVFWNIYEIEREVSLLKKHTKYTMTKKKRIDFIENYCLPFPNKRRECLLTRHFISTKMNNFNAWILFFMAHFGCYYKGLRLIHIIFDKKREENFSFHSYHSHFVTLYIEIGYVGGRVRQHKRN
jgi:hypothetical protein